MPSPFAYEPVLSSRAASFLIGLSKAKQKTVIGLMFQLADHPSQLGDYATREDAGREIQHLMVGDWHFSFWPDHPVRELRITEIAEL
jgi:hypothetical protein